MGSWREWVLEVAPFVGFDGYDYECPLFRRERILQLFEFGNSLLAAALDRESFSQCKLSLIPEKPVILKTDAAQSRKASPAPPLTTSLC